MLIGVFALHHLLLIVPGGFGERVPVVQIPFGLRARHDGRIGNLEKLDWVTHSFVDLCIHGLID